MAKKTETRKCQVANCENPASCRCKESKLRYCKMHRAEHGTSEHKHSFETLPPLPR